jgi:multidrug efflux pump subunit AcrB
MNSILAAFARHRVAANVMMFVIILCGLWSLNRINTQFLPDFELKVLQAKGTWAGASVEDIQSSIAQPLERAVLALTSVDKVESQSIEGRVYLTITLKDYVDDISAALDEVDQAISGVILPEGADDIDVQQFVFYDPVADILVYGDLTLEELQIIAENAEKSLRASGIAKVDVEGIPEKNLAINVPLTRLLDSNQSLNSLGNRINGQNLNTPSGNIGDSNDINAQLRFANETNEVDALSAVTINQNGAALPLDSLAKLEYKFADDQLRLFYQGQPAVQLKLSRTKGEDTLEVAEILKQWQTRFAGTLPPDVGVYVYNENWKFVQSRISIIVDNGLGGMLLVMIILFVFLNTRLAWWVAAGIPVSFLGALIVMDLSGNSINMISLFGFLIALGIIVDDAIVVGEDAYSQVEQGKDPVEASISAAQRMLPAIIASSATTIAAFLPLLLVGGQAGTFTKSVPLVVIFAILASLIECFLILPGHLAHSLKKKQAQTDKPLSRGQRLRRWLDSKIDVLRHHYFRKVVRWAVNNRRATFAVIVMLFICSIMLLTSGRVKFAFFPAIESPSIELQVEFSEGGDPQRLESYLATAESQLRTIEANSAQTFIVSSVLKVATNNVQSGSLYIELDSNTDRIMSNEAIVSQWRDKLTFPAGLISWGFAENQQGPGTSNVSVRLVSEDLNEMKAASVWLQNEMTNLGTLINVADNLPLGSEQLLLSLNQEGLAIGLSPQQLASEVRSLLNGIEIQQLRHLGNDLSIKLQLQDGLNDWHQLAQMPINISNTSEVVYRPLGAFVDVSFNRAIAQLNRVDGELSVIVSGKRANEDINLNEVNAYITDTLLPQLQQQFSVNVALEGDAAAQSDFFIDVQFGAILGLFLIFGILAWVFESWVWPIAVMAAIPLGLTGALFGHWVMGLELSVLSVYGIFGLSGIVINDSIVLVTFYRRLRQQGMAMYEAIEEAAVQRFRPVILTSLTTCAGLTPLLFESAFDAQFLIPMAAGLVFGLAYATVLILVFVPALLTSIERRRKENKPQQNQDNLTTPTQAHSA